MCRQSPDTPVWAFLICTPYAREFKSNAMTEEKREIDQKIADEILDAVRKLRYGEVVVTVYNSKVVQIEKKEKKRFN